MIRVHQNVVCPEAQPKLRLYQAGGRRAARHPSRRARRAARRTAHRTARRIAHLGTRGQRLVVHPPRPLSAAWAHETPAPTSDRSITSSHLLIIQGRTARGPGARSPTQRRPRSSSPPTSRICRSISTTCRSLSSLRSKVGVPRAPAAPKRRRGRPASLNCVAKHTSTPPLSSTLSPASSPEHFYLYPYIYPLYPCICCPMILRIHLLPRLRLSLRNTTNRCCIVMFTP